MTLTNYSFTFRNILKITIGGEHLEQGIFTFLLDQVPACCWQYLFKLLWTQVIHFLRWNNIPAAHLKTVQYKWSLQMWPQYQEKINKGFMVLYKSKIPQYYDYLEAGKLSASLKRVRERKTNEKCGKNCKSHSVVFNFRGTVWLSHLSTLEQQTSRQQQVHIETLKRSCWMVGFGGLFWFGLFCWDFGERRLVLAEVLFSLLFLNYYLLN